jgi:hypothetical protein
MTTKMEHKNSKNSNREIIADELGKVLKGMLVSVYRNAAHDRCDCTNGGMSSKATQFVVVGEGLPEIFSPSDDAPLAFLFPGHVRNSWRVVPADPRDTGKLAGPMFGGNYVGTCDSRWHKAIGGDLVPVHDRYDTWEDNEILSR